MRAPFEDDVRLEQSDLDDGIISGDRECACLRADTIHF